MSDDFNEIMASLDAIDLGKPENEVVTLSKKLPLWQKDALRRITQKGELDDTDKAILKTAMYANHKLDTLNDELTPLATEHCKSQSTNGNRAILCAIGPVENVNQLAENQPPLQFAPAGVTLIYGDNGSGKSGYSRIAKKVCRARTADDNILGNAYSEKQGTPSAKIWWQINDGQKATEHNWTPDQAAPDALSTISVFDTKSANLYVDGKNRMEYLPFEVDVYKKLAELCNEFQDEVSRNITNAENEFIKLPELTPETGAAKLIEDINNTRDEQALPSEATIIEFTKWSEEDATHLKALNLEAAQNPLTQADIRGRCAAAIAKITTSVKHLENGFSDQQASTLRQKYEALQTAKIANDLAAENGFSDLELNHVGSDIWQQFFKYARAYSEEAYPGFKFPNLEEGAKCVLCHHPLDEDARQRFIRFDDFITGKAAEEFQSKTHDLTQAVKALNEIQIQSADDAQKMLVEFEGLSEERKTIVTALSYFLEAQEKRKDALIEAATQGNFQKIAPAASISNSLDAEVEKLKAEEIKFRNAAQDDEAQKKQAMGLAELEGRKSLSENAASLIRNRATHERLIRLNKCLKDIGTRGISLKVSKLRERHLTNELNSNIKEEIMQLDLGYLDITIKDETLRGESNFHSDIGKKVKVKNAAILSEGEQRGMALACFLAEVNLDPVMNGIIVDDPVSSLDHQRIEKTAKRLVEEAGKGRQVVILTHNILFYQEVISQAGKGQIAIAKNVISRKSGNNIGFVEESSTPYDTRKVTECVGTLGEQLAAMKKAKPPLEGEGYKNAVEHYCTELRKTWERMVETVLLNGVSERFHYGVETLRLKGVCVTDDDYQKIFHEMKALSNFVAHDIAAAKQGAQPDFKELGEFLETFSTYHKEVKKRAADLGKERKKLESPPEAEFAKL